ncbi:MAG: ABC transporter ATP-binding protein [Betaproteobacteria bacterium]|nr:ABC transporter ATP-binding protein [Betaproteobacteria bacterium]
MTSPNHGTSVPLVHLQGVGKDYATVSTTGSHIKTVFDLLLGRAVSHKYTALSDIDISIGRGESWGIIGENGAGKSTLLKIIAGVVKHSSGEKSVNGRISALLELGTGFHPEYSGRENVFLASALMGWTRAETSERLEDILAFADIGEHIDHAVKTYSSGMIVRLGFAVATALKPDLLVTDEVLAVGDESFQKKCLRWMENYRADGGALLLCSHSMYHVQSLCDNAIWIHHGRTRACGEAFAVTQAYLAYHEQKSLAESPQRPGAEFQATYACMESLWIESPAGEECHEIDMGTDILLHGVYTAPDDQPTVVMAGAARIDGTPVFGTFSNEGQFVTNRLAPGRFGFCLRLRSHPLLPGKYHFKAHTLDVHGLRLFDTLQIELSVRGRTREHGLVRIEHEWVDGHLRHGNRGK